MTTYEQEIPKTDDLLVVQLPYVVKTQHRKEALEKIWESLLYQKSTGVVVLDAGMKAILVPKNVEIVLQEQDSSNTQDMNEDHFLRLVNELRMCSGPQRLCGCCNRFQQKDGCDKLESDAADAIEYLLKFIKETKEPEA